jgi:hypothetical protein
MIDPLKQEYVTARVPDPCAALIPNVVSFRPSQPFWELVREVSVKGPKAI